MKISFLTILLWAKACTSLNLLSNPSFESPVISTLTNKGYIYQQAVGWGGYCYEMIDYRNLLGFGQYIDLQGRTGINGYIEQNVTLANESSCVLTFYQKAWGTNYPSYVMEVIWNGVVLATQIANVTTPTFETFTMMGQAGINSLKFKEIGDKSDYVGMFLDQINLTCQSLPPNITTTIIPSVQIPAKELYKEYASSTIGSIIAVVSALPINHAVMLRYLFMYEADLWLYHYDKEEYEGYLDLVFSVIAEIEKLKFQIINKVANVNSWKRAIFTSDYIYYTRQRFVEIEQSSSVVSDTLFTFFVYIVPQNVLITIVLCRLFKKTKNSQISQNLRKFYFFKTSIAQTLLEGNIAYFTYVAFGNLQMAFSFCSVDKMSLVLAVLLLWAITLFCLIFYPLVGQYLKKQSGYFIYCAYRFNPGYCFLHVKVVFRSFLQGVVFYFLHQYYEIELLCLGLIEVGVIVGTLALQQWKEIFIKKLFFCMMLGYHFLFLVFNLMLYFDYLCKHTESYTNLRELALYLQNFSLFLLISHTVLTIILDALPLEWLKKIKPALEIKSQVQLEPQLPTQQKSQKNQKNQNNEQKVKNLKEAISKAFLAQKNGLAKQQLSKSRLPKKITLKPENNLSQKSRSQVKKPTATIFDKQNNDLKGPYSKQSR